MGREIRKVPPNWKHPKDKHGNYQPMLKRTFAEAAVEWKEEFAKWETGWRPDYFKGAKHLTDLQYREYAGEPPANLECYRSYSDAEATWIQMWETVSEGTPVTPPFATPEELVEHLATKGTFYDPKPWKRENAEAFVKEGWAPAMIFAGGRVYKPEDGFPPA